MVPCIIAHTKLAINKVMINIYMDKVSPNGAFQKMSFDRVWQKFLLRTLVKLNSIFVFNLQSFETDT